MQVLPEFSAINTGNAVNGIPGVDTRRVQTTVELREGQTIALAGLFSNQTNTEVTRVPFISKIPVVGPLVFSGKRATQDETELLILVTPEIIRPMEPDEVPPVPGHEVTHPNDHELYLHGMTEGAPDQNVYQLAPYGHGSGEGLPVGYSNFNPAPASPGYAPEATYPFGGSQAPLTGGQAGHAIPTFPGNRYPVSPPGRRDLPAPPVPGVPSIAPADASQRGSPPAPQGPSAGRYGNPARSTTGQRAAPPGFATQAAYEDSAGRWLRWGRRTR
jgi:pilus assembly protein CpaC